MKFICLTLFVVCLLPAAFAKPSEDEVSQLERADPWWSALRAEAYYRQCQSSCTEHSRGVATTVELCDDTEVGEQNSAIMISFQQQQVGVTSGGLIKKSK
jgi:hypothetical protein